MQLQKSENQQIISYYNINWEEFGMNKEQNSQNPNKQKARNQNILTIHRTIDTNFQSDTQQYTQRAVTGCIKCGIKENDFRYCNRVIIISIQSENQTYCYECLEQLWIDEQKITKSLEERYIYHNQFQASINENQINYLVNNQRDEQFIKLQFEVQKLEGREEQLDYQLGKAKQYCQELQDTVLVLEQKQEKFWLDMNKFQKRAVKLEEKSFIGRNQGQLEKKYLEMLSKTSMVHNFFKIQIEDNYAQVYGMIIGKKPQQSQINWEQTNAALGHLLLAYNYLILKYNLTYTRISDIKLKGNLSQILLRDSSTYYPIGYGITIGSVVTTEKIFGILIECLLSEMADLAQHIQQIENIQYTEELKLPFNIEKKQGKILDLLVNPYKLQQKSKWSQWTKAMRYFLIDFKHILTIASLSDPFL